MTDKEMYHFYLYEWLSLKLDAYPEVMLLPAPVSEVLSIRRVYLETLDFGFRCSHLWLSALVRYVTYIPLVLGIFTKVKLLLLSTQLNLPQSGK